MEIDEFRTVELGDRDLFRDHFRRYPPQHSDYSHATMYTWREYMTYRFSKRGNSIVILGIYEGRTYPRPPVGPRDIGMVREVIDLSLENGWDPVLTMVGKGDMDWIGREFPELTFEPHRDYFDYVYLASDLADLPGKGYLKVRNSLNRFMRNSDHSVEKIDPDSIDEVKDFLTGWCRRKECGDDPFLEHEGRATMNALTDLFELGLEGLLVRVDGDVEAFSIFERMLGDMMVVHHEKANLDIPGLYQAINNETARFLEERCAFINREADMGVPGLRLAKERYRPHHMMEIFHARVK